MLTIRTIITQNITLVYDSLDLRTISINDLRELRGDQTKPTVMDTPEMIVAIYPPEPVVIQMGDRRIRITLPQPQESIDDAVLHEVATKCDQLAGRPRSQLVAYGFNFDVAVELPNRNAHEVVVDRFLKETESIKTTLDGSLISFSPRLMFERNQVRYDLVLEPVNDHAMKVHLNAHFQHAELTLPATDQLSDSFAAQYEYLVSLLSGLLGGDE